MPISPADEMDARESATRDAETVAAVLRGETVSYRDLVERYQRLVYAVTWSCLGDATMAEDAAQEAFIRAYRSLPLLGNGAKFSAWVTTIARNTAISLGIKQRRELANRTRWALEHPASEPPAATAEEFCPPETLRTALAELSAEHRESLVLFYLEGKRGAEAAAALGISEAALRMRLLRARAALWERLEARLGESLAQLQPPRSLTPGVMGVVLSSSTAKAGGAGMGATLLAALGKVLPFKIALVFVSYLAGSGLVLNWTGRRALRKQLRNLRDQEGFRAKIYRKAIQGNWFWSTAQIMALLWALGIVVRILGWRLFFEVAAGIFLVALVRCARRLRINRGKYVINWMIGVVLLICCGLSMIFDRSQPSDWAALIPKIFFFAMTLHMVAFPSSPPPRLDNDLFLREQVGQLPGSGGSAVPGPLSGRLSSGQLFSFARFLGERYLVYDFRWARRGEELLLRASLTNSLRLFRSLSLLDPVVFLWSAFRWKHWTWICLKADGTVSAHCSEHDAQKVREEPGQENCDIGAMERRVATAVETTWRDFRAGNINQAERAIGQVPDTEIFVAPPNPVLTKESAVRAVRMGIWIFVAVMLVAMALASITKELTH